MSPLFPNVPTTLDLNGPELSFTTQPVGTSCSVASGIATFTGIATATFPVDQTSRNSNTGAISYQWYKNSTALTDGTNVTGSGTTTLTLSGLTSPTDNNTIVFLQADYVPSAYTGSTPNAINEPLNSNNATLTVLPTISITTQPEDTTVVEDIETSFSIVASTSDSTDSSLGYQWYVNGSEISGANSATLSITRADPALDKVYCSVSHPTAQPGIVTSTEANLDVSSARTFIRWEKFGNATRTEQGNRNLATSGPFTARALAANLHRTIQMWSPEKDIDVKITMGGAAGANKNGYLGGQGGISVFKMTLKQNTEYTVKLGVNSFQGGGPRGGNNGGGGLAVIYEKARVLAVCGGGGGAGTSGRGGDGGGLNVVGETSGGNGGLLISVDELPTNGMTQAGRTGVSDFDNSDRRSGRLSGCTIGKYWREQGKLPCEDLGNNVEFLTSNGATYSPTTGIERGYKVGQGHRNNGGAGSGNEGGGGAGARGGEGASGSGAGGGGASGYYASQVELLPSSTLPNGTQLGGNADVAFISVEAYSVNDDQEPLIPPTSGTALVAERTVTWTVTRSSTETVTGVFSLTSGIGPSQIGFGPNGETKTSQISSGAVYTLTGTSADKKNLSGNTLTLSDDDSNPGSISITPDIGRFSDNETWEANW